ncbi:MAG: GNAT family N-acetyltransferase [Oscillospiraceae bacterium]|nr:GNAT family N-acetyltransferase [Oscillospiraceae bacterium]
MIRPATISDAPAIMSLLKQVRGLHHNIRPDIFGERKYTEEELSGLFGNEKSPIFVYEEDGKVLGHLFCSIKDYTGSNQLMPIKSLYIDDFCVDENARGKGIGTKLYEFAKDYAKEIGCHNLTLCVWEGNDSAKAFYDKMGMGTQRTVRETIL